MRLLLPFLLVLASRAEVCPSQTRSFATNFSWDSEGQPDTRNGTWGKADVALKRITWQRVPRGCRVRVVHVYGDFLFWPIGNVSSGSAAGALLGLRTTAAGAGSDDVDWGDSAVSLYVQDATKGEVRRVPLDSSDSLLLERDNILVLKMATWLNDTGRKIHIEPSLVITFQYEPDEGNATR